MDLQKFIDLAFSLYVKLDKLKFPQEIFSNTSIGGVKLENRGEEERSRREISLLFESPVGGRVNEISDDEPYFL